MTSEPQIYIEFQKRRSMDEERVMREAESCLFAYMRYTAAVSKWNAYVSETLPYVKLFSRMAGPLTVFAGFGGERDREPGDVYGTLYHAQNDLLEAFRRCGARSAEGTIFLPQPEDESEREKAESFHLTDIPGPELTYEEMEILTRKRTRPEDFRGIQQRLRREQKENVRRFREKRDVFMRHTEYLERKLQDREKHFFMREAVKEVYPMLKILEEQGAAVWKEEGQKLLKLWPDAPGRRICFRFDGEEGRENGMNGCLFCPGLYWREEQSGGTAYERIMAGGFR